MDSKLILIKTITLLYTESICESIQKLSNDLALSVIDGLRIPEQIIETDTGRNTIIGLRDTLIWMTEQSDEESFMYEALLQRIRINAGDDYSIFQAFEDVEGYSKKTNEDLIKLTNGLRKEIKSTVDQWSIRDVIQKAHRELFYGKSSKVDYSKFIENLVADLETYRSGWTKDDKTFILNLMDMSDPDSLAEVLEKSKESYSGNGGFKSGWHAFNRMLGKAGALRRGEFVVVGGLTHCYKSGLTHDLYRHACIYNDPELSDEKKKPTILYFSSENNAEEDLSRMYVSLRENETRKSVDVSNIDSREAGRYVANRLSERGWSTAMLRIDPHNFTIQDLFNVVLDYESKGHEIQAVFFDYLALISKDGSKSNMMGEDIRLMFQKVRSFMTARNILFVTPHQLSQEAMYVKRSGVSNFVAEIAGKNYWDGSKRIANEVDLEVYVDKVMYDGKAYLAVHRGKHRETKVTSVEDKFFYIPFDDVAYVPDDIYSEDSSIKSLTAATSGGMIEFD